MTLNDFTNCIILKDNEVIELLKKLGKKGYCVLWYHEAWEEAISFTIYETKAEAEYKITINKNQNSLINKTKIIKL